MYAVAVGDMFDAVTFHGPFVEHEDASWWACNESNSTTYWIVPLFPTDYSPQKEASDADDS